MPRKASQPNFYVGTSGFSYKEWKGTFYPEDLPMSRMLGYYGEQFRTVEINNTFYRMPTESSLGAWIPQVPEGFKFVLKAPQIITHFKRLKGAEDPVGHFVKMAATMGDRLGPLLFQLPPNLKKDLPRLRDFMALLPDTHRFAFEFRHQTWFDDEVFDLLRERHTSLCIAEAEEGVEVPFVPTADWGYVRLRKPEYTTPSLSKWLDQIRGAKWVDAFVFFKHEDAGVGPKMAKRFLELADK